MRKTILFLAILAICGGSAFSQTTEPITNNTDNPTNSQWTIGASVGVTLNVHDAGVGYMKAFSYTPYFGIGADLKVRYNVTNWLACRSGFYIMGKNYVLMHEKGRGSDDPEVRKPARYGEAELPCKVKCRFRRNPQPPGCCLLFTADIFYGMRLFMRIIPIKWQAILLRMSVPSAYL